ENAAKLRFRNRSLHRINPIPAMMPSAILPDAPIHPLSNAYFTKYETPISVATIPMRFSESVPIWVSSSCVSRSPLARGGGPGTGGEIDPKTGGGGGGVSSVVDDA